MLEKPDFDFIIAGGGCAGLSLAYAFLQQGILENHRLLILEKEPKSENDRTWCFWEKFPGPFENLVHHRWESPWFFGPSWSKQLIINPYQYKMIRSDRFYAFIKSALEKNGHVEIRQEEILHFGETENLAFVQTQKTRYSAQWIFNSLVRPKEKKENHHYLLQHFVGWYVKTEKPIFLPSEPYLMDFRIPQKGECRFMYVLPTSEYEALVEFTLFSEAHLPKEEYAAQIREYLGQYFDLKEFSIQHEEFGSIPMFSEPFPKNLGKCILNIGTAGGQTKASTGYTFTRIQKHSQALAFQFKKEKHPILKENFWQWRHTFYDKVLLHVLRHRSARADKVFQNLFRYNSPATVFRFLDEETHFLQEYKIINTVPILPFIKAAYREMLKG
jgi:lycopene beta-cyclase